MEQKKGSQDKFPTSFFHKMARPEGFEPPAYGFEVRRSIQLSYGRISDAPKAHLLRCRSFLFFAAYMGTPHS